MKIAVCQLSPKVGQKAENLTLVRDAVVSAVSAGAKIVVVPELANTGYSFRDYDELAENAENLDGPTLTTWAALAHELDIVLVGGFVERGDDGAVFNSAAMFDTSGLRAVYRKVHLWNYEKTMFTAGDAPPPVIDTPYGRLGLMICYDIEFPEWVRTASLAGVELLCCPANWPLYPRPENERPASTAIRTGLAAA
jgi:predicted amidohydrolase